MAETESKTYTAFAGEVRIASGNLAKVALAAKAVVDKDGATQILIFDDATAKLVEIDFRGHRDDVLKRLPRLESSDSGTEEARAPRGPGRPKLGVVAREVTLLPRHWQWLGSQPGGASVALRKLVEEARRANGGKDRVRESREAAYRFMSAMAGDAPGFEEAARALFAGHAGRFARHSEAWPVDIRDYARRLSAPALEDQAFASPPQATKLGLRKPTSTLP
jgi:uncharacterized protein